MSIFNQYKGLNKEIYVLFFGRMISAMGTFIWPLMTLILRNKFNFSAGDISVILVLGSMLSIPAVMIGGKLTDKFGRKKLIVFCSYVTVLCYFACGILPLTYVSLLLFFAANFFSNLQGPAYEAMIADKSSSEDREKAYSLSYLGFNLGFILGPSIGGLLFKNFLWLAFIIDGATTLIGTILIHVLVKEGKIGYDKDQLSHYEQPESETSTLNVLLGRKALWIYLWVTALLGLLYMQINFLLPLNLTHSFGDQGVFYFGLISSMNGLIVIVFTPIFTQWLKKLKEITKMGLSILLFMLGIALFGLFPTMLPFFFIGMVFFTWGEIVNTLARSTYFTLRIPASHRGRISAVISVLSGVIAGLGQILFGRMVDVLSYPQCWAIIVAVGAVTLLLTWQLKRYDQRDFSLLYNENVR